MSDILSFLPQPTTVPINGKTYNLTPFTVNEMAKLQKWLNDFVPNPYKALIADSGSMSPDARRDLYREAASWKPPVIGSDEASYYISSFDGLTAILKILMTKADPSLTDSDIANISGSYTIEAFTELMGRLSEIAFGKNEDPKA